jgi:hypothetical protein
MTRTKAIEELSKMFDSYLIMEKVCLEALKAFNNEKSLQDRLDEITDKKIALLTAMDALREVTP